MGEALLFALKYWPVILGGVAGYGALGKIGIVVGAMLGAIVLGFLKALKWAEKQRRRDIKRREIEGETPVSSLAATDGSLLLVAVLFLGLALAGHGFIVQFALSSPSLPTWIDSTEPLANAFGHFIPAFDNVSQKLAQRPDLARATRHILTLGWLFIIVSTAASVVWGCMTVGSDERPIKFIERSNVAVFLFMFVAVLLAALFILYFGWVGSGRARGIFALAGLTSAFVFFVVLPAIIFVTATLQRRRFRRESLAHQHASRGNIAGLRALFRKRRDKTDADGI